MDYAIQLLLPILGGLLLGNWLHNTYGLSYIWTLVLAILGMVAGIAIMYRRVTFDIQKTPFPTLKKTKAGKKTEQKEHPGVHHQEVLDLYKKLNDEPPEEDDRDDFGLKEFLDSDDDEPRPQPKQPPKHDDES